MTIPNLYWKILSKLLYNWMIKQSDVNFAIRPILKFIPKPIDKGIMSPIEDEYFY